MPRLFLLIAFLGGIATTACSSTTSSHDRPDSSTVDPPDAGDIDACEPLYESDANLTTPTVTFATTVLPVFEKSCGIAGSTCHGAPNVTFQQRPYLGDFDGGTDAQVVLKGLVGVPSSEDPQMNLVTAGNPPLSFLMHKLDGDQCNFAAACEAGDSGYPGCGTGMPYLNNALPAETRDTVRRWIAQGAKGD